MHVLGKYAKNSEAMCCSKRYTPKDTRNLQTEKEILLGGSASSALESDSKNKTQTTAAVSRSKSASSPCIAMNDSINLYLADTLACGKPDDTCYHNSPKRRNAPFYHQLHKLSTGGIMQKLRSKRVMLIGFFVRNHPLLTLRNVHFAYSYVLFVHIAKMQWQFAFDFVAALPLHFIAFGCENKCVSTKFKPIKSD